MAKVTIWASEKELARLAGNHLMGWVNELGACEDAELNAIGNDLTKLIDRLRKVCSTGRSSQVPPGEEAFTLRPAKLGG